MCDKINGLDEEMKCCSASYEEKFNFGDTYLKSNHFFLKVGVIIVIVKMVDTSHVT